MTRATMLLLLWEALQHRETTFVQVAALAAACGLDASQVLTDHFALVRLLGLEGPLTRNRVIVETESACQIEAPAQALSGVSVQGRVVELFKEGFASDVVHAHENLRGLGPRQAGDHVDHRPVAKKLLVLYIRQKVVGPIPVFVATVKAGHRLILNRLYYQSRRVYAYYQPLSKLFQARYSCNVSGGVA